MARCRFRSPGVRVHAPLVCLLLAACASFPPRPVEMPVPRPPDSATPIQRALHFLVETQEQGGGARDGNWPHHIETRGRGATARVRDLTSGMTAYVATALAPIRRENAAALGLDAADLARAAEARRSAAGLLVRCAVPSGRAGVSVYGWWPPGRRRQDVNDRILAAVGKQILVAPAYDGPLVPPFIRAFPPSFGFWPDIDDTVLVGLALLEHAEIDGGTVSVDGIADVLPAWRDLGTDGRVFPPWLEGPSGAFLTWIECPRRLDFPNDVDLAVNANVLHFLAREGRLDAPGADEATALIARAVREGRFGRVEDVSLYYPDNGMVHHLVARAHRHGPVPALAEATAILADDIERRVAGRSGDRAWWRGEEPSLATALAVLTLLDAGRDTPLVDAGIRFLLSTQDPVYGNWPEASCCEGRIVSGQLVQWRSKACPTACAMLALCRYRLARRSATD